MEELVAAIPIVDSYKNVSSQEFQDLLMSWFEKKGILSELRTNLRYKMINVLKNTAIGRDIIKKSPSSSISLSKQAINLIVAEFLMKSNCDYSLSLFNTEAGLSNTFSDNIINDGNKVILQFDEENILNILELIGVHKMSDLCDEVLNTYYKDNDNNSLLSALITVLSKCVPENVRLKSSEIDLSNEPKFIKKVGSILIKLNLPCNNITGTIENIKCLYNSEIQNMEDNYTKLMSKLKNHMILRDKQTKEIQKKNELLEVKILQLTDSNNELKMQVKHTTKDKLITEKELVKIKRSFKKIKATSGHCLEEDTKKNCQLLHCGESCKENNKLVIKLQNENQELIKRNTNYLEEVNNWKSKYENLFREFTFVQQKIISLNLNNNIEVPTTLLNLNATDSDMNHLNGRSPPESTQSPDSSTDEIICDARKRLKVLEDESREIEEKFKNTHTKNRCKLL